jgi:hypothetical protein
VNGYGTTDKFSSRVVLVLRTICEFHTDEKLRDPIGVMMELRDFTSKYFPVIFRERDTVFDFVKRHLEGSKMGQEMEFPLGR